MKQVIQLVRLLLGSLKSVNERLSPMMRVITFSVIVLIIPVMFALTLHAIPGCETWVLDEQSSYPHCPPKAIMAMEHEVYNL